MAPKWELTVERLGRVEHANVVVRPLTLFAGPNNSGKSYVASLLWGLVAMQGDLEAPEGAERDACDAWIRANLPKDDVAHTVALSPADVDLFGGLFGAALDAHATRLVKDIFNFEAMEIGKISFRNVSIESPLVLRFQPEGPRWWVNVRGPDDGPSKSLPSLKADEIIIPRVRGLLMRYIALNRLAQHFYPYRYSFGALDPIYLPASRTGFMQLYKSAARRSLLRAFKPDAPEALERQELELTTPAFHFIDMIAHGLKDKVGKYAGEAEFLESALSGRVEFVAGLGGNEYRYHPTGATSPLPMQLSSALVTELAPLVLVLRHLEEFPVIVLEEPEAHLHPELQRRLAQVVVRLIRKGVCVWITTHSENFCQQLNNFLKLGTLSKEKRREAQAKLDYGPQDYLELEDISGYEFKPDASDAHTEVVEMKRTPAGLVMPTFNKAIVRLNNEVMYLDDLLADEGK